MTAASPTLIHSSSHSAVDLRVHPSVEMLVARAAFRDGFHVVRVLVLPDAGLSEVFLAELLRMIAHTFDVVRHPLRG